MRNDNNNNKQIKSCAHRCLHAVTRWPSPCGYSVRSFRILSANNRSERLSRDFTQQLLTTPTFRLRSPTWCSSEGRRRYPLATPTVSRYRDARIVVIGRASGPGRARCPFSPIRIWTICTCVRCSSTRWRRITRRKRATMRLALASVPPVFSGVANYWIVLNSIV